MRFSKFLSSLFKSTTSAQKVIKPATKVVQEETFGGVPLSEFNKIAKQCFHGIRCSIDQEGFLIFHSSSNSGKTKFHTQLVIDELGKLVNLGGHYPGQWWSSADEFAKKVNETFKFKK